MARTQQYLVQKYVMAESVEEAVRKSRYIPIHEVYIHSSWFDKVANNIFYQEDPPRKPGFEVKKT